MTEQHGGRRHRRYPAGWFDGGTWELDRGIDVPSDAHSSRQSLHQAAWRRNLKPRVSIQGDKVYFQAVPRDY